MDKIILGILMLRRMTAYEIRNVIKKNFRSMCSDSLGSIQAALKKLLSLDLVTCEEVVEKGINKKRYAITEIGQDILIEWIKVPIDLSKTKNMDSGKLLFMGFIPRADRENLLDNIILSLEREYQDLKKVKDSIDADEERAVIKSYLLSDIPYQNRIKALHTGEDITESILQISRFTLATLDYGLDLVAFNISWFKKFKERICEEYEAKHEN